MSENKVIWVVQSNMINDLDANNIIEKIKSACASNGDNVQLVDVRPFSNLILHDEIDFKKPNVYYGTTTLGRLAYPDKGFFFNENFSYEKYIEHWLPFMLNSDGVVCTVGEIYNLDLNPKYDYFIRPNSDLKQFAGSVMMGEEILNYCEEISGLPPNNYGGYAILNQNVELETKVYIGEAYNIEQEIRCFMVAGKCVAASNYRTAGKFDSYNMYPGNNFNKFFTEYAESVAKIWQPHEIFVLDLCKVKTGENESTVFVLEAGCFNWTGLYSANITDLVTSISDWRR